MLQSITQHPRFHNLCTGNGISQLRQGVISLLQIKSPRTFRSSLWRHLVLIRLEAVVDLPPLRSNKESLLHMSGLPTMEGYLQVRRPCHCRRFGGLRSCVYHPIVRVLVERRSTVFCFELGSNVPNECSQPSHPIIIISRSLYATISSGSACPIDNPTPECRFCGTTTCSPRYGPPPRPDPSRSNR